MCITADNEHLMLLSPAGLSHTPRSDKSEMSFNPKELETYLPYTKALKDFLAKYDDDLQKDQMFFEDCGGRFCSDISPDPSCFFLLSNTKRSTDTRILSFSYSPSVFQHKC